MRLRLLPLLLLLACRGYDAPNKPLPDFKATTLDGEKVDRRALEGAPAVIALWVPG